jgi:hypothetical protein
MSRKGPKGAKGPSEALKKEDIVQAVVIADSFKGKFCPITYSVPTVCVLFIIVLSSCRSVI